MAGVPGLTIEHYDWPGGREAMLRFGPPHGPTMVAALPFFEEANRTRAAMVDVLRQLAVRGIGSILPDLPGTNESLLATSDATLAAWRGAFAAACTGVWLHGEAARNCPPAFTAGQLAAAIPAALAACL